VNSREAVRWRLAGSSLMKSPGWKKKSGEKKPTWDCMVREILNACADKKREKLQYSQLRQCLLSLFTYHCEDVEPPADMIDEDEDLFAQYQHSQSAFRDAEIDEASEDDFSWVNEDEWQRAVEGAGRKPQKTVTEDIVMDE
jgi:hypothetical protein